MIGVGRTLTQICASIYEVKTEGERVKERERERQKDRKTERQKDKKIG